MIEVRFSPDDLSRVRFVHSPLAELVASSWALRKPAKYWMHRPWRSAPSGCCRVPAWSRCWRCSGRPTATCRTSSPRSGGTEPGGRVAGGRRHRPVPGTAATGPGRRTPVGPGRTGRAAAPVLHTADRTGLAPAAGARAGRHPAADLLAAEQGGRTLLRELHPLIRWDGAALRVAVGTSRPAALDGRPWTLLPTSFSGPTVHAIMEGDAGPASAIRPLGWAGCGLAAAQRGAGRPARRYAGGGAVAPRHAAEHR
ncbi:hypothetical protein NKG94_42555 [Micromonospora sp. M12]